VDLLRNLATAHGWLDCGGCHAAQTDPHTQKASGYFSLSNFVQGQLNDR